MRISVFLLLFSLSLPSAFSQPFDPMGKDSDDYYETETALGINLNTNGGILGGFMFKRALRISDPSLSFLGKHQFKFFALELVNVKHPKEQRVSSPVTGNTYIYYKENYLFVIRPQIGREMILFNRAEEEGVRVNGVFGFGPSLGLLKPYAIDYDYTNYTNYNGPPLDVRAEPFDPKIHTDIQGRLLGTGGFLTATGKTKVLAGINLKGGLGFEFGNSSTGVEVGGLLEWFPNIIYIKNFMNVDIQREAVTIPGIRNNTTGSVHINNVFSSIYINIYFADRN